MTYDPFVRGSFPVGVRSHDLTDPARQRTFPVEVWYPAAEEHQGQDLAADTQDQYVMMQGVPSTPQTAVRDAKLGVGKFPLIGFSHGLGGHRRQTTHFCAHLASHGFVVASPDHVGNTFMEMMTGGAAGFGEGGIEKIKQSASDRPRDMSFIFDQLLAGEMGVPVECLDAQAIGMTGHSFGGWTALQTAGQDSRVRASLPLAPGGGRVGESNPVTDTLVDTIELGTDDRVSTLLLAAAGDVILPLEGVRELYGRVAEPKRMIILQESDHFFFCDNIASVHTMMRGGLIQAMPNSGMRTMDELCDPEAAYAFIRGLGLAHMDAVLKGDSAAADLLGSDLVTLLKGHGADIELS